MIISPRSGSKCFLPPVSRMPLSWPRPTSSTNPCLGIKCIERRHTSALFFFFHENSLTDHFIPIPPSSKNIKPGGGHQRESIAPSPARSIVRFRGGHRKQHWHFRHKSLQGQSTFSSPCGCSRPKGFYLVTHQGAAGALLLGQTQCRGARMNRVLTPALFHTRSSDELTYPAR